MKKKHIVCGTPIIDRSSKEVGEVMDIKLNKQCTATHFQVKWWNVAKLTTWVKARSVESYW